MAKPIVTGPNVQTRGSAIGLGPQVFDTPQGPVLFVDAPGMTVGAAVHPDPADSRVMVMVYHPDMIVDEAGTGSGLIVQLDIDAATQMAAALLRNADEIGRKVQ